MRDPSSVCCSWKGRKIQHEICVCGGENEFPGAPSIPRGFQRDGKQGGAAKPPGTRQGWCQAPPPEPIPEEKELLCCRQEAQGSLRAPRKRIRLGNITQLVFL